jgi:hypothetical protein
MINLRTFPRRKHLLGLNQTMLIGGTIYSMKFIMILINTLDFNVIPKPQIQTSISHLSTF